MYKADNLMPQCYPRSSFVALTPSLLSFAIDDVDIFALQI